MINLKELVIEKLKKKNIDIDLIEFKDKSFTDEKIILCDLARTYIDFTIKKLYDEKKYFYPLKNAVELIEFKYGCFEIGGFGNYKQFDKVTKEFAHAQCHICFTIHIDIKKIKEKDLEKATKPEPKKKVEKPIEIDLTKKEEKKKTVKKDGFFKK